MKKMIAAMLLCVASSTAFAQTEKGTQNIGLSFGIQNSNSKISSLTSVGDTSYQSNIKVNAYNIGINYSYFIADKLDIGLTAGYAYGQNKQDYLQSYDYKNKSNTFLAGIQLRKYVLFNDKLGIRTGPSILYQRVKETTFSTSVAERSTITHNYTGQLGLDFVFYPIKNLGITSSIASVNYTHSKSRGYNTGSSNSFAASFVNNLNLGFFYSW